MLEETYSFLEWEKDETPIKIHELERELWSLVFKPSFSNPTTWPNEIAKFQDINNEAKI